MTVLPVIERELRAEARNSYHHWLRLGLAAVGAFYLPRCWRNVAFCQNPQHEPVDINCRELAQS
jgi:hypothetical protein